jgi:phage regulator Rha-like protein
MANITIIQTSIYEVREQKVMFDFDLAILYRVETKRLKEAVRRNKKKFPSDFMFELIKKEWNNLRSQFASSSWGGIRYPPFAFTEHGVTMLASILNSDRAIKMNIAIVRAFISLKQVVLRHKDLAERLEELRKELHERIAEHDTQLAAIYDAIENLLDEKTEKKNWEERERIGYR